MTWLSWTLASVGYLAGGVGVLNFLTWTEDTDQKITGQDITGCTLVLAFWPLAAVVFLGWGLFWLSFRPYRIIVANKRRLARQKAQEKKAELTQKEWAKRRQELAKYEKEIGLNPALRVGDDNE